MSAQAKSKKKKRWRRQEHTKPSNLETVEIVARKCLQCGKGFKAKGRFLRLCPECREAANDGRPRLVLR